MTHRGPVPAWLLAGIAAAWPLAASADLLTEADCVAPLSTDTAALCMSADYARLDAELERAQADAVAAMADPDGCGGGACDAAAAALADAHDAWQRFRARDCDAIYALAIAGSGRNDARLTCLIDHTRLRIGQLQQLRAL
ncbi:lysozyme inhibitor LprI family protein [Luteimonas sp. S4-F44]|uniref:lysozyme inhibitor LprI family protein n=1 Tax=Luteimonas sp. S4-F44 TaxID=2925842 RepID=UPI001F535F60|nr:lysozyme inhibitor LprI family protein [Luteimonas sp. S4-F44]UNK43002.1 lysozyme inhibitor LprI family protein [Luteimonas sp. S4-F44]